MEKICANCANRIEVYNTETENIEYECDIYGCIIDDIET